MLVLFLSCAIGLALSAKPPASTDCTVIPHGHSLTTMVDNGFDRIDRNGDGKVTTEEFDWIINYDDKNNDSCVDFNEYHNQETQAQFFEINRKMYDHFDPDGDNCLDIDEMNAEFNKIDVDADALLVKHEFEHYYTTLLRHLFGQQCHHG